MGLQPRVPVRGREHVRLARRPQGPRPRRPRAGIAVFLDVVYNHLGPSDLDLWQFDGWAQNGKGGIYFYEDERSTTPWGETRPDYGRSEVRAFLRDSAFQWLDEFRVDGLRWDATAWISSIYGGGSRAPDRIPDGWRFMAEVNAEIAERYPGRLTIAEDLRSDLGGDPPGGGGRCRVRGPVGRRVRPLRPDGTDRERRRRPGHRLGRRA